MRYMLLVYGCHREELPDAYDQITAYYKELQARGVFVAGDPLHLPHTATTVQVRGGDTLMTDGPFTETHEALGGYFIVDCAGLDEALELARLCPLAQLGSVEVRPILETSFG
jgi:hypothetical protein